MKKIVLSLSCLLAALFTNAQSPTAPATEWAKGIGSTGDAGVAAMAVDASGNVYTVGSFNQVTDFDPSENTFNLTPAGTSTPLAYDIFVSKLDANGNFVWAVQLGGTDDDYATAIALDKDGNPYVTGSFMGTADFDPGVAVGNVSSAGGSADIYVAGISSGGTYRGIITMGGTASDAGYGIAVDKTGNIYVTGYYAGTADFAPGAPTSTLTSVSFHTDIFVAKYNATATLLWAKSIGGTGDDEALSIALDTIGNVYTTGFYESTADFDPGAGTVNIATAGGYDGYVSKLDASGNYVWAMNIGGAQDDEGTAILVDDKNRLYFTGRYKGTVDFDPGANTANLTANGGQDIYIARFDAAGNYIWTQSFGSTDDDYVIALATDTSRSVYTTGFYDAAIDFDPGAGTYNLTPAGGYDVFISKLDSLGNFVWAQNFGNTADDLGSGITTDAVNNVYVSGDYQNVTNFAMGSGTLDLTSSGVSNIFVCKIDQSPVVTAVRQASTTVGGISIYPNPSQGAVTLTMTNPADGASVQLYNSVGTLITSQKNITSSTQLDFSNQEAGLYYLRIISDTQELILSQEIIKE